MHHLFEVLNRKHLIPLTKSNQQQQIFKKSIEMIEIETFSYCNRKCWFCPNSYIDRHSTNNLLSETFYHKLLSELQKINYANTISFSRYNEPLADKIILKRLAEAKEMLPTARLHTNTNGDYLTRDYLELLYENGLNSLNIQLYLSQNETFSETIIQEKIDLLTKKLNLPFETMTLIPNEWHEIKFIYKNMRLHAYARNFEINACNRGGLVDLPTSPAIRTAPCASPFHHIYIDYNGNVMPCCNLRSDSKEHVPFILGNISESTIFEIFTSKKSSSFRRTLYNISAKTGPCKFCNFAEISPSDKEQNKINKIKLKDTLLNWLY